MLCLLSPEDRVPKDHPLREIRRLADRALAAMSEDFDAIYADGGRRSVPPERLLKSSRLTALYSIRSERQFCEQLEYNLLFRWFLDMDMMEPAFDPTTFTKNRRRLMDADIAAVFFATIREQARDLMSREHFSVDGTLLEAWASMKSFRPKEDDDGDNNGWADFRGHKRKNVRARVEDRSRGTALPQRARTRSAAVLRRTRPRREPSRTARRLARQRSQWLRRAADRTGDGREPPRPRRDPRRRPGLRHPSFRRRVPRAWRHAPRHPAPASPPSVRHRRSNHAARGIPHQPDHPDAHRAGVRLAQDRGRSPPHPVSRQTQDTVCGLPRRGRLQPSTGLPAAELRGMMRIDGRGAPDGTPRRAEAPTAGVICGRAGARARARARSAGRFSVPC